MLLKKQKRKKKNKKANKYKKKFEKDYQRIQDSIQEFNIEIWERKGKSDKYRIKLEAYKIGNSKENYIL